MAPNKIVKPKHWTGVLRVVVDTVPINNGPKQNAYIFYFDSLNSDDYYEFVHGCLSKSAFANSESNTIVYKWVRVRVRHQTESECGC